MLARAVTTASSLAAEQDSDNIIKTQTKATSREKDSAESNSQDGNPSQMENIGGSEDETRFDTELCPKIHLSDQVTQVVVMRTGQ